jgi:hypothetical protein
MRESTVLLGPAYAEDGPMDADLQALIDEAGRAYAETERGRAGEEDRRHQPPLWDWRANREERRRRQPELPARPRGGRAAGAT